MQIQFQPRTETVPAQPIRARDLKPGDFFRYAGATEGRYVCIHPLDGDLYRCKEVAGDWWATPSMDDRVIVEGAEPVTETVPPGEPVSLRDLEPGMLASWSWKDRPPGKRRALVVLRRPEGTYGDMFSLWFGCLSHIGFDEEADLDLRVHYSKDVSWQIDPDPALVRVGDLEPGTLFQYPTSINRRIWLGGEQNLYWNIDVEIQGRENPDTLVSTGEAPRLFNNEEFEPGRLYSEPDSESWSLFLALRKAQHARGDFFNFSYLGKKGALDTYSCTTERRFEDVTDRVTLVIR